MVAAQGDWRNSLIANDRGVLTFTESTMDYDKPFKTYDEQLSIMESRNIIINDRDFARRILSSLSYYTIINGYKNTFLSIPGTDNFSEGTNFNDLYTLHMIDTNLNTIILKNIFFVYIIVYSLCCSSLFILIHVTPLLYFSVFRSNHLRPANQNKANHRSETVIPIKSPFLSINSGE